MNVGEGNSCLFRAQTRLCWFHFPPWRGLRTNKSSFLLEYFKHLALFGLSSGKGWQLQSTPCSTALAAAAAPGWETFLPWTQINNHNGANLEPEVKIALRRLTFFVFFFLWTTLENRSVSGGGGRCTLTGRAFRLLCNEDLLFSASGRKWWREKESVEVKKDEWREEIEQVRLLAWVNESCHNWGFLVLFPKFLF